MKKILFFLLMLCFEQAIAQGVQTNYYVTTIANMKLYYGNANRIHVTGTNEDYILCTSCTADENFIYAGLGGRKWKKFTDSTIFSFITDVDADQIVLDSIADPSTYPVPIIAGDRFLVADGAAGVFSGEDRHIAIFEGPGWNFDTVAIGSLLINANAENFCTNGYTYKLTASGWLRQNLPPALLGGNKQFVKVGSKNANPFHLLTNGVARLKIDAQGNIVYPKLTGPDTAFALLRADGRIIRGDLDSLLATVGSFTPGYGLTAGSPTDVDTLLIATKERVIEVADSLGAVIDTKVNISDTAAMLDPYLRDVDTTNKWINDLRRQPGSTTVEKKIGNTWSDAYEDSTGTGGGSFTPGYGLTVGATTNVDTTKINTKLGWFDFVQDFGGDSTGATDNTAKMQLALDYAAARGGGVIYVRNGTYLFSGTIQTVDGHGNIVNGAQIWLPYTAWSGVNKAHVVILGETPPVQYTSRKQTVPTTKGVIFKSNITDASGGFVLGTAYNTDADAGYNFNQLTIENIQITVRSKTSGGTDTVPTIGGINADRMGYVTVMHSVINSESAMASTVQPTSNIGFKGPGNGNWARVYLEDVAIYNFFTGVQASEHFSSIQLYAATCVNGIELIAGTHSVNFVRPLIQWCVNNIKISGTCYFKLDNVDLEAYSTISGNPSKWYLPSLDIYEPSTTNSIGLIHYQKTISNVGVSNNTFTVSGTISPAVKYRMVNDFYETFGINTNTPLAKLHIQNGAVPSFPTIQANDLEIGEATNDYFRSFVVGTTRVAGFRFYKSGASTSQGSIKYEMGTDQMDFYTNQVGTPRMSITSTGAVNFAGNINVGSGKFFVDVATSRVGINNTAPARLLQVTAALTTLPTTLGAADVAIFESTGNINLALISGASSVSYLKWYKNGSTRSQDGAFGYDQSVQQFRWTTDARDISSTTNMMLDINGNLGVNTANVVPNSKLQIIGSVSFPYRVITTGRTLDATDDFVEYTGTGTHTVTLPTAVGITGRFYTVKNAGTGNITFTTTSSQTIDGVTSITMAPGDLYKVRSDNANWRIENKNGGLQSRVTTQFDATSTTTLTNVTGLTSAVIAGKTYRFEAKLYTTSNVAGGVKVAIGGTATATNIIYEGLTTDAGVITQSRGTALATAVGAVTAVTAAYIEINGTITVNAAGTLTVQFAQNASNGTASSVLVGSTFVLTEMQ